MIFKGFFDFKISTSLRVFLILPWFVILYFGVEKTNQYSDEMKQAKQVSLSIDVLKIDRSFIEGAISDQTDASLVEAVVLIGHSLQLKLVGEGIETQQHFDYLASLGCDYGQGYYISKPISVKSFIDLCQTRLVSSTL